MDANNILVILMFVTFIGLLFTGYPIAFVLGGTAMFFTLLGYCCDQYFGTITGLDYMMVGLVVNRIYRLMDNWVLVAVPMFIFMGLMLNQSGIAEKMMEAMQDLFGQVRGGLAVAVTVMGIIFAASTGIIGASVVLLGLLSLPVMLKQGYQRSLAVGTVCSAGTLGILIPPSIMLVIMADQLGLSVGDLFTGAVFPGIILGVLYAVYIIIFAWLKPQAAPLPQTTSQRGWSLVWKVMKAVVPPALLILAVLGSIFAGITTPTEASGVGACGAILLTWFNRKLSFAVLQEVAQQTFKTTAYIFAIFIGATCFALVLRGLGGDEFIEGALTGLPLGPAGTVALVLFIVFALGFFLDWIEITLIILPLLAPVISGLDITIDGYGVIDDPKLIWFTLLVAISLQTSFLTPPVGFAIFYLKGVAPAEVKMMDIYKGVLPFVVLQLVGLLIVAMLPQLVIWLPALAYGY